MSNSARGPAAPLPPSDAAPRPAGVPLGLHRRAQEGDRRAFDALVGPLRPALHGYAASVLGDPHLAEDVVQEAFLRAWHRLGTLRHPSSLRGWLYRIVEHVALTVMRGRGRRRERPLYEAASQSADRVGEGAPVRRGEAAERRVELAAAIARLPPKQASVVRLHYFRGRTCREVATALGITTGNVRVRLHRAREALRRELEAE